MTQSQRTTAYMAIDDSLAHRPLKYLVNTYNRNKLAYFTILVSKNECINQNLTYMKMKCSAVSKESPIATRLDL